MSDELGCPPRYPDGKYCQDGWFECNNHFCVTELDLCDGRDDCGDGSDEAPEMCQNFSCAKVDKFKCSNYKCIPEYSVCNGVDDCGDGSDENNITRCAQASDRGCASNYKSYNSYYSCANGNCVWHGNLCNMEDNCGDGSDERGCHYEGKCDEESRGGCQHRCNNLSGEDGGYICLCNRGYVVDENNPKKCIDVNECQDFGHNCTQICTNEKGSYSCSCRNGFELSDKFSGVCRSVSEDATKVLFTTGSEIHAQAVEGSRPRRSFDILKNQTRIVSFDYNPRSMMVFWVDEQEKAVKRSFIPGSPEQPEARIGHPQGIEFGVQKGVQPEAIAVDWVTGNLYWTEVDRSKSTETGYVAVAKNDGRYKKWLVSTSLERPTSIAVDPEHGLMFWTDAGSTPKIERAWMDGSKRRAIVTTRIRVPEAITIDYSQDHMIYWADSKLNLIEIMNHDGEQRHVIMAGSNGGFLRRPLALDVFESEMYWVNRDDGAVVKRDKFGRGVPVSIARNVNNPRDVKVLHSQRYNLTITNPCASSSAQCSHLCLVLPRQRKRCACPNGQSFIDADRLICDAGKTILIFKGFQSVTFVSFFSHRESQGSATRLQMSKRRNMQRCKHL